MTLAWDDLDPRPLDHLRYRRCQIKDCPYKEFRGWHRGFFVKGRFICPTHAFCVSLLGAEFEFKDGSTTTE